MSFSFSLKNWQVCQWWILSDYTWKCLFCLHFWRSSAGHRIPGWQFSSLSAHEYHSAFILGEKPAVVNHMNAPLYVISPFSLATFKDFLFLWLVTSWLSIMCLGTDHFVFPLLEVCWTFWMRAGRNSPHVCSWTLFLQFLSCPNHDCNPGLTESLSFPISHL